jgi:hypothetical protein
MSGFTITAGLLMIMYPVYGLWFLRTRCLNFVGTCDALDVKPHTYSQPCIGIAFLGGALVVQVLTLGMGILWNSTCYTISKIGETVSALMILICAVTDNYALGE